MNLHEHCLRNVAGALRDIARIEHPDLTLNQQAREKPFDPPRRTRRTGEHDKQ